LGTPEPPPPPLSRICVAPSRGFKHCWGLTAAGAVPATSGRNSAAQPILSSPLFRTSRRTALAHGPGTPAPPSPLWPAEAAARPPHRRRPS
jgi:hypothetical protein